MRWWFACALLVGCRAADDTPAVPHDAAGLSSDASGCVGPQPCNSYTCSCGAEFTVCAGCRDGKWEWPIDDNCYFACPRKPVDAGGCIQPAGFDGVCKAPPKKAASTVCTDAMLDEILTCLGPTPDKPRCDAIKAAAPACATCALSTWWLPGVDDAACVALVDPTCAVATRCARDCTSAVCPVDACDTTPGSGTAPGRSQWDDCVTSTLGLDAGAPCAKFAAARAECIAKAPACFPSGGGDLRRYLRAVCTLGGDVGAGDAGVGDAATDGGGAGDAAP